MTDWKWIIKHRVLKHPRATEPEVTDLVLGLKGDLFIDIGSNSGWYPSVLRNNFRRIVTVDPNPKWKADMRIAISNFDGEETFFIGNNLGSADSLINTPHILGKDWINRGRLTVKVRRFDTLNLDADLVKIDVEGAEFKVLEGMQKHLPRNLIVELHDERREHDLVEVLVSKHYSVQKIDATHFYGAYLN